MAAIVLYPSPGMGHLISMVELGKLILTHQYSSFTINILLTTSPYFTGSAADYISSISTTTPSIIFHHLPNVSLPLDPSSYSCTESLIFELMRNNNHHVHESLVSISRTSSVRALIVDFFCAPAHDVASKLNIPVYYFYTSGATSLALFLYFPTMDKSTDTNLRDLQGTVDLPGLPPIPFSHMPEPVLVKNTAECNGFLDSALEMAKADGIIVNTFDSLEPKALEGLRDGIFFPDGPTPPVFCIGPLIATGGGGGGNEKTNECLTWLDMQPSQSVVFLSFGSMGLFAKEQLMEIAVGLERSEQRFLWVVRNTPSENEKQRLLARPEPDLNSLLPEGFLDRTKDRGLVVKNWAPQVAVLNHDSVGGFVTHCGWNSILESICAGVPMIAWPLYAEQKINKMLLVDELKLALPASESDSGLVSAGEVEKQVRELMEMDAGKLVRKVAATKRNEAVKAIEEGGSSNAALDKLVHLWK